MSKLLTIAIDGPAASGKSTLAKTLADKLGYLYFDTGAMYRAVTLAALERGISVEDEAALQDLANQVVIDLKPASKADGRLYDVSLNGKDCTWAIRSPQVDAHVSQVSAFPGVRRALTEQQRRIGNHGGVVMAGRDIGTVVLPEADLKIYLDASQEERARRRHAELQARGTPASFEEVLLSLKERDQIDAHRAVAPMRPAPDAFILQSDGLDQNEVLQMALRVAAERRAELVGD